jgi:ABC-type branched-subunit amino acid transport system substrate-binding protein
MQLGRCFLHTCVCCYCADFLKAAAAANLDLPLYGGDSLADVTLSNSVANTPGATQLARITATAPNPGQEGFVKVFNAFDGGKTPFNGFAATAYDAMVALLQALKAAGPPYKGEGVLQQLLKQTFEGGPGFAAGSLA